MRRVLTALVLAPLIVAVIAWGPQWAFLAVLAAVALLCFYEYSGIVAGYGIPKPGPVGYAAGLILLLAGHEPTLLLTLVTLIALSVTLAMDDLSKSLPRAGALMLGVLYVFGSWRCAIFLRARSPWWLLFALALNWIADSAAYYVGRAWGRHRMAPSVSPKKSWEGAAASLLASILFAVIYLPRLIPTVAVSLAIALGAAGNVAGQLGDLAESALKRGAGIKDSGTMLPGHGGWLDRVDSALFAIPVIYWILSWRGL